jgi:hypothetical protein
LFWSNGSDGKPVPFGCRREGKLWVKLNSGPLKEELMMSKGQIVDRLNDHLGRKIIAEVIIQ